MEAINSDYSNNVRAMAADLWDLEFHVEANETNEKFDEMSDFIYTYDIGFPLAKLIALEYVDFDTLPELSLNIIESTWVAAMEQEFFSTPWA